MHTHDEHHGAEPVDVIATTLLRQGFALLTALDLTTLLELPVLADWSAELDINGRHLRVTDPTGSLYDGDLGPAVPTGWHHALDHRGLLVLLVASGSDLEGPDRAPSQPVLSYCGLRAAFDQIGILPRQLWSDRILHEAAATADPIHLIRLFGIHSHPAVKYINAAHPDKAIPSIR